MFHQNSLTRATQTRETREYTEFSDLFLFKRMVLTFLSVFELQENNSSFSFFLIVKIQTADL